MNGHTQEMARIRFATKDIDPMVAAIRGMAWVCAGRDDYNENASVLEIKLGIWKLWGIHMSADCIRDILQEGQ